MISVSEQFASSMQKPSKTWDIQIPVILKNGQRYTLTKQNIVLGTVEYVEGSTCLDTIQVGSTFSNGFNFSLLVGDDKQFAQVDFTDAVVEPVVGLWIEARKEYEYVPLGRFYVVDSSKKLSTIAIKCLDQMCKANVSFDYMDTLYPANAADVLVAACNKCDFNVDAAFVSEVRNLNIQVHSFGTEGITCRNIIASAGALIAKNVRFNRNGTLEAFWYSNDGLETTESTRVSSSSYDSRKLKVTKVIISDNYGQAYSIGSEGYTVALSSNPLVQSDSVAEAVLTRVLAKLQQLEHYACGVYNVGDPRIQASDLVTHVRPGFETITVPIMKVTYKFGSTSYLETLGTYEEKSSQPSKQEQSIRNLSNKTNELERQVHSEIAQFADSIKLQVTDGTPGKTASIVLKVGDTEYSGSIDLTGLVTLTGLATADGTTEINGGNIVTGLIKSQGGNLVFNLDAGYLSSKYIDNTVESETRIDWGGAAYRSGGDAFYVTWNVDDKPVMAYEVGDYGTLFELQKQSGANNMTLSLPPYVEEELTTHPVQWKTIAGVPMITDPNAQLKLSASDVGARPATYVYASKNGGDCNSYVNETHLFVFNMSNKPSAFNYGFFDVWKASGNGFSPNGAKPIIMQRFINWQNNSRAWRLSTDGGTTWGEWAYDNPFYKIGTEYLTTKWHNSKPVYTKLVNVGALPNNSTIEVSHGVTATQFTAVRCVAYRSNGEAFEIPFANAGTQCQLTSTGTIKVKTDWTAAAYSAHVILEYTKS